MQKKLDKFFEKKIKKNFKILRALCGPMRFKIVSVLMTKKEGLSVSGLAFILGVSLSRLSHQLSILGKYELVTKKKRDRETVYSLLNHRIKKIFSS